MTKALLDLLVSIGVIRTLYGERALDTIVLGSTHPESSSRTQDVRLDSHRKDCPGVHQSEDHEARAPVD